MDNGKYGPPTGSPASGNDRFGYFGGTPTPGAPNQPSTFGVPAVPSADQFGGPPPSQFGGPPPGQFGGPTDTMVQPYAGQPPQGRSGRSTTSRWIGGVLAAVVVIGGGFFGWNVYQRSRPVTLPATFGGQPLDIEPAAQTVDQSMLASMRTGNPGIKMDAKIYGTGTLRDGIILGVARGHDDLSNDLHGQGLGTPFVLGNNTCAQATTGVPYTLCIRTSANLTVVVATLSGAATQTSALVDQAWGQS